MRRTTLLLHCRNDIKNCARVYVSYTRACPRKYAGDEEGTETSERKRAEFLLCATYVRTEALGCSNLGWIEFFFYAKDVSRIVLHYTWDPTRVKKETVFSVFLSPLNKKSVYKMDYPLSLQKKL